MIAKQEQKETKKKKKNLPPSVCLSERICWGEWGEWSGCRWRHTHTQVPQTLSQQQRHQLTVTNLYSCPRQFRVCDDECWVCISSFFLWMHQQKWATSRWHTQVQSRLLLRCSLLVANLAQLTWHSRMPSSQTPLHSHLLSLFSLMKPHWLSPLQNSLIISTSLHHCLLWGTKLRWLWSLSDQLWGILH